MAGGSCDREHIVSVAARLAPDVGGDELKAVVDDVASSRQASYQMDDIGGYSFNPMLSYGTNRFSTTVECSKRQVGSFSDYAAQRAATFPCIWPTEHPRRGAADLASLGCGQTCDALLPSSLAEARPYGHRIRTAAAASSRQKYCVHPPRLRAAARSRPRRELADRPRSTRAHCAPRTSVVMWANSRQAPPQLHGHGSAAWPPHQVGGCGFKTSLSPRSTPVARDTRAHRPVDNRTTAHGAHVRTARCRLSCGARSSVIRWPRLGRTATASGRRLRLRTV